MHGLSGNILGRIHAVSSHFQCESILLLKELTLPAQCTTESGKLFQSDAILSKKKGSPDFSFGKLLEELVV